MNNKFKIFLTVISNKIDIIINKITINIHFRNKILKYNIIKALGCEESCCVYTHYYSNIYQYLVCLSSFASSSLVPTALLSHNNINTNHNNYKSLTQSRNF